VASTIQYTLLLPPRNLPLVSSNLFPVRPKMLAKLLPRPKTMIHLTPPLVQQELLAHLLRSEHQQPSVAKQLVLWE